MDKKKPEKLALPDGRVLAAPSWVYPASLAENCEFLSGRVDEVGLLFFQAEPCLAYGREELPPRLAALPLSWHVHLPTDLGWQDPAGAAEICLRLMDKAAFLGARRAVLHPPEAGLPGAEAPERALELFLARWEAAERERSDILLENQPETEAAALLVVAERSECSICFDLAHFLLHTPIDSNRAGEISGDGQAPGNGRTQPDAAFLDRVRMLHLCAPSGPRGNGTRDGHAPLTALSGLPGTEPGAGAETPHTSGLELARRVCRGVPLDAVFMLELFKWQDILDSYPLLRDWLG